MSADVTFGDLEKLASTAGVKEVYLANYYDEPVVMPSMDSANDMTNITKVRGYDTGKGTVIAVIDTGITPGHEAFTAYDSMLNKAARSRPRPRLKSLAAANICRQRFRSPMTIMTRTTTRPTTSAVTARTSPASQPAASCRMTAAMNLLVLRPAHRSLH